MSDIANRCRCYLASQKSLTMADGRTTKNIIGPAVAKRRIAKGWSQATLAVKCQLMGWDVSRSVIAGIEGRHRVVEDWELFVLSDVLDVSTNDLRPENAKWPDDYPSPPEATQERRRDILEKVKETLREKKNKPMIERATALQKRVEYLDGLNQTAQDTESQVVHYIVSTNAQGARLTVRKSGHSQRLKT
jgi:hypothetical protein